MLSIIDGLSIAAKLKALAIGMSILAATHSGANVAGYLVGGAKQRVEQATSTTTETINRIQSGEKSRDAYEKMSERACCHSMPLASGVRNAECG